MNDFTGTKESRPGLSYDENGQVATCLLTGNYDGLLQIIDAQEQVKDKQKACEVVVESMYEFNETDPSDSTEKLLTTALSNIEVYGSALKELIFYTWANHLEGERFWKNPAKDETLFLNSEGEIISFKGELGKHIQGPNKGMQYIVSLGKYEVLTGRDKGVVFEGSDENDPSYRPVNPPRGVNP